MKRSKTYVDEVTQALVQNHALTPRQAYELQKAFSNYSHYTFDDFVLEEGFVDKEDLLKALSSYYKVPAFDVNGYFFNHLLVTKFPKDVMHRHGFIPLDVDDITMLVVASDPSDPDLPVVINRYVSYDPAFLVGIHRDIIDAINEYYDNPITVNPESIYTDEAMLDVEDEQTKYKHRPPVEDFGNEDPHDFE